MLKLFYMHNTCSAAAHIVLKETGAPYTPCFVDFALDAQKSPEYLRINPKGRVPALTVDDRVITENPVIQFYLATRFPEAELAPADPLDRMEWLSLITWLSNTMHTDIRHVTRPYNYSDEESTYDAIRDKGRKLVTGWLADLDARLERRTWMMGDQYTTADPYALVYFSIGKRLDLPISKLKNFPAWKERMLARPAVYRVFEEEQNCLL